MSVWLTIPSARPNVGPNAGTIRLWKEAGYEIALWKDLADGTREWLRLDGSNAQVIVAPYPGYARAVNALASLVFAIDPAASFCVAGGDDTLPDPNHTPKEIARQCEAHFGGTFGVMQPTGDRWAGGSIDRICGSPWLGREYCARMYGGKGPLFEGYTHMHVDEEAQHVAIRLGVLWQRRDLIHLHNHFLRTGEGVNYAATPPPHLVKWNTPEHWNESKALFESRKAAGFPGHEPLGMNALAVA